jgi:hypothetical protein
VAAECLVLLRLSRVATDPQSKAMLLHMAASWIRLANGVKGHLVLKIGGRG